MNDPGVKDMLSWLITMRQNQWIAAIKELEAKENIQIHSVEGSVIKNYRKKLK